MKSLILKRLFRSGANGLNEELLFTEGVNVIVGRPNTGKSKWLQMLDFTLGSDKQPEESFGEELAAKYDVCSVSVEVDGHAWNYNLLPLCSREVDSSRGTFRRARIALVPGRNSDP